MTAVFLHYTQAELDDAYDQRFWARDAAGAVARLGTAGAAVRLRVAHAADLAYGPGPGERLDWFHAPNPNAPIHFHVHGGAWRILTKHDASFAAPAFVAAGVHHVVPDFSKLPGARLPDVVEEVARALEWVFRHAREHGGDPTRIVVSGHSSGAHVAAVLLTLDWAARGLPPDLVRAAVCVGGMYDLGPVMLSARANYVSLDAAEVAALSPARHAGRVPCPVTLVSGERESPEFRRQTQAFGAALEGGGRLTKLIDIPGADHFDVNEAFGEPGSPVHRAVLDAI
jgi:arylformamidase